MRLFYALLVLLVLVALPAFAADTPVQPTVGEDGCTTWTICDDLTAAGVCKNNGTDNSVVRATSESSWTAFTQDSDATTAYTVKLYSTAHGQGYHATHRALINSSDITYANPMFSWDGIMGDIYAELGGVTGDGGGGALDGVTVVIKGCSLSGK